MWKEHSLSPESSRTWFVLFCLAIVGFMAVMIAGALGEDAVRQLIILAACAVFLVSGGFLGLLVAHQVCQTHLRDDPEPAIVETPPPVAPEPTRDLRRSTRKV